MANWFGSIGGKSEARWWLLIFLYITVSVHWKYGGIAGKFKETAALLSDCLLHMGSVIWLDYSFIWVLGSSYNCKCASSYSPFLRFHQCNGFIFSLNSSRYINFVNFFCSRSHSDLTWGLWFSGFGAEAYLVWELFLWLLWYKYIAQWNLVRASCIVWLCDSDSLTKTSYLGQKLLRAVVSFPGKPAICF